MATNDLIKQFQDVIQVPNRWPLNPVHLMNALPSWWVGSNFLGPPCSLFLKTENHLGWVTNELRENQGQSSLLISFSAKTEKYLTNARFLMMLYISVELSESNEVNTRDYRWRKSDLVQNITQLLCDVAFQISFVTTILRGSSLPWALQTLPWVLQQYFENMERFKSKIGKYSRLLSGCYLPYSAFKESSDLWNAFVESTRQALMRIRGRFSADDDVSLALRERFDALDTNLFLLLDLVDSPASVDFKDYAASVVERTVTFSCSCWFSEMNAIRTDGNIDATLFELQYAIDLRNPDFLHRFLNCMRATNEPTTTTSRKDFFLNYLLKTDTNNDLYEELISLALYFYDMDQGKPLEDMQGLWREIQEMFSGVGFLYQPLAKGGKPDPHLCFNFLVRICLLKVEIFLKEQLPREPIGELNEVVCKFKRFFTNITQDNIENGKQTSMLIEGMAKDIQSINDSFQAKEITEHMLRNSMLVVLTNVLLLKVKLFLMDLRRIPDLTAPQRNQVEKFCEDLELSNAMLHIKNLEIPEDVDSVFGNIEAVSRRITCASYPFLATKNIDKVIDELMISFSNLLDEMNHMKTNLKVVSPQFPVPIFPGTNEVQFVDCLLKNLNDLLIHDPVSIVSVKRHVKGIQLDLKSFRPFLFEVSTSDFEHLEPNDFCKQIVHVAYNVAYVIDLLESDGYWQHMFWFYNLIQEIRVIKDQVIKIQARPYPNVPHKSSHWISRPSSLEIDDTVLGLRDQEEAAIIQNLVRGSKHLHIVSLVGMPGIGKTTLAKKVYNNSQVASCFHNRRAWCSVSQKYDTRELLLKIFDSIGGIHQNSEDDDLADKLRKQLKGRRYLIVMDDVWEIGAFDALQMSFPDDENGSRILITSRLHNVASEASPRGVRHDLRLFTEEESWNLLEMKIFHRGGGCPEELVEVGKEIAQLCRGLPLSVVAVAGILGRTEKKPDCWKKIAESLSSQIIHDEQTQCMEILKLSYMNLPLHLRECFLYFSAFPEDKDIPVSNLIRLWIAEGFVEKIELKSLEDTAEDYLVELINRSLVMISRKRSNGMVKLCRIHDLLRDFCLSKAKEYNLLCLITGDHEPYRSFKDVHFSDDLKNYCLKNPISCDSYRLCVRLKREHFVDSSPSGPWTRSLLFLASSDTNPKLHYKVSFISRKFKVLTMLNMESINISNGFLTEFESLVHLRYLAVRGIMETIPGSIAKLWRLETFIVKGLSDEIVLPDAIWCMGRLKHLHVKDRATFNLQGDMTGNCFSLDNLVTFSSPSLSHGMESIIRWLPNLCKLSCIFKSLDSPRNSDQFPELGFLQNLESLRIIYSGSALSSAKFNLPMSIKKLTLSDFGLPWNQMHAIGRLPNLEVLKLRSRAFEGPIWDMEDEEFCKLKYLMLESLNIAQWNAFSDHLPELQQLVLRNCVDLEEIPYDFAEINTLEMIEVHRCRQSVEQSVRNIVETCDQIKFVINRNFDSSDHHSAS